MCNLNQTEEQTRKSSQFTDFLSKFCSSQSVYFLPRGRAARNRRIPHGSDGSSAMAARSFIPDFNWTTN